MRRSQDLQDQTEKVVGSLTALSNQLATVTEPLKQSFNSLGNLFHCCSSIRRNLIHINYICLDNGYINPFFLSKNYE